MMILITLFLLCGSLKLLQSYYFLRISAIFLIARLEQLFLLKFFGMLKFAACEKC